MAQIKEIVIDALNPQALARFWAEVLDDYAIRPYDDEELARLAEQGLTVATDPSVAVDGSGPTLFFQRTLHPKNTRNRVHLDLRCASRPDEVARLQRLGATIRDTHESYTVRLDPEGNEFCIQS